MWCHSPFTDNDCLALLSRDRSLPPLQIEHPSAVRCCTWRGNHRPIHAGKRLLRLYLEVCREQLDENMQGAAAINTTASWCPHLWHVVIEQRSAVSRPLVIWVGRNHNSSSDTRKCSQWGCIFEPGDVGQRLVLRGQHTITTAPAPVFRAGVRFPLPRKHTQRKKNLVYIIISS